MDAISVAVDEADGTFADAELETRGGSHFWEISLDTPSGGDIEFRVDVVTGEATVHREDEG